MSTTLKYEPALDGLRAFAVGAVLLYHFDCLFTPGGFLGVDVFFVLSGYLITSLLLAEWSQNARISLAAFWERRARRLLPALFLVIAAVVVWARFATSASRFEALRSDALWTLFYGANWHFITAGRSYFDMMSEASPLRHAWSLAIEEQFYLVWPLVTLASLRAAAGRPRVLTAVCIVGAFASAASMALLFDPLDPNRAYYGTDARTTPLFVGALLAILLRDWTPRTEHQRRSIRRLGLAGAAACIAAVASVDAQAAWMYHGGYLAFALASAAWIAAAVQPDDASLVRRALASGPLVWLGRRSYGIYLWHWPLAVAISEARTGLSGWELGALRVAATLLLSAISYALLEMPIRQRRLLRRAPVALAVPLASAMVAALIVAATAGGTAAPTFLVEDPAATSAASAASVPTAPLDSRESDLGVTRILLLGDSVAATLADTLAATAAARGVVFASRTRPGCGLTMGTPLWDNGSVVAWAPKCVARNVKYQEDALREIDPDVVVWLSSWETSDQVFEGRVTPFGSNESDKALLAELEAARFRWTVNGRRMVLVTLPAPPDRSDRKVLRHDEAERRAHLNALFRDFAAAHSKTVAVAELASIVCPGAPPCPTEVDGIRLRPEDGNHFEQDGPAWVGPRLYEEILAALGNMGRG